MENAALESYKKDIEMSGDITSMAIRNKLRDSGGGHIPKKLWHEKRTRDGKTYYVNIMTNRMHLFFVYLYVIFYLFFCRNGMDSTF